jgi:L-amino acid N-acyltransferase YncA
MSMTSITIIPMTAAHWPAVKAIYEAGIATGNATFETQAPAWDAWDNAHLSHSRLVATDAAGTVLGWAALSAVSSRCVYGGVAEISIYIGAEAWGQGVGRQLLQALIADSEAHGIWTLQAGTFAENTASIGLHTQAGFRVVGYRERIGRHHGVWRNTVQLERRSPRVGNS